MLTTLLLSSVLGTTFDPNLPSSLPSFLPSVRPAGDASERIAAAGDDVAVLWQLTRDWLDAGDEEAARAAAERILRLDDAHEGAHETLRHHRYDDRWFETYTAMSKAMRSEAKRMWDEKGLVRFRDRWLPPADVPFERMGWARGERGEWISPAAKKREADEAELRAAGWQQQDLVWVPPDEFDSWREGLYKCGDSWLTAEGADEYHAKLGQGWEIAGEHFIGHSTLDRESTRWALWYADQVFEDLTRLVGRKPQSAPHFVVLNSAAQYNTLAAGDPAQQIAPTEASGASSVHYAYFSDAWYENSGAQSEFLGRGVCYWERTNPSMEPYGQHAVRHAAAQSFLEAIDPSWDTVSRVVVGELSGAPLGPFWSEKKLPQWFRHGAASYSERYFRDAGAEDPAKAWWARDWALSNLRTSGLRPLEDIFAYQWSSSDPADASALLHEAGLLVSFILDGDCKPVQRAHQDFVDALALDADAVSEATEALQKALVKNRKKIEAFAGI